MRNNRNIFITYVFFHIVKYNLQYITGSHKNILNFNLFIMETLMFDLPNVRILRQAFKLLNFLKKLCLNLCFDNNTFLAQYTINYLSSCL